MIRLRPASGLLAIAAAITPACQSGPYLRDPVPGASSNDDLVLQLSREASAIASLFGFRQILFLAVLVLLVWAATRALGATVRFAWRVGLDPNHNLATARSAANVVIAGWAAYAVLRQFLAAAPLSTLLALALAVSTGLVVFARHAQNLWAGVTLSFRRSVREGDRVVIGEHEGIVREIGLIRLQIRCGDGATVFVPNRLALQEPVRVERARNSVPVVVRAALPANAPTDALQIVRNTALLSPYRVGGTAVEVSPEADGSIRVEIQVWSERALREAHAHLEAVVAAALNPEPATPHEVPKRA